jgi:NADPH:quinone reductase-like Zn-dependent oxidoreductase
LEHAATVPVAGCTAYEALLKLQIDTNNTNFSSSSSRGDGSSSSAASLQRLLIVGGAGGVGSWATLLARARYPSLEIVATASSEASRDWCRAMGANHVIPHEDIASALGGPSPNGSVDYILCLTEATPSVMEALSQVIHPYGTICLVVAGKSISQLDLSFCFYKAVTVTFEAVFASSRTNYERVQPAAEMEDILQHLADATIPKAPLAVDWLLKTDHVTSLDWKEAALVEGGLLDQLATGHTQGKLVMKIESNENYE